MSFKNAIFDLDGTIVDSSPGIYESVRYALDKMGIENYDESLLKNFIGPPLTYSFSRYFNMSEADADKAVVFYRENYSVSGVNKTSLYEGMKDLLSGLKQKGIRLYIASSKPQIFVEKVLADHNLTDYFDFIAGATFDKTRNSKTDVLKYLIDKTNIDVRASIMIGDRFHDIEGAHNLNMKCAAVLFGFGNKEEFLEYKADYIAKDCSDLYKIIT
ncbi:MAG: HAD-IA family hydrolase [Acutalibacteraceae bacterium]|nr:HAD-IA family hydrolase [Acutalibacteraceae bacterium]